MARVSWARVVGAVGGAGLRGGGVEGVLVVCSTPALAGVVVVVYVMVWCGDVCRVGWVVRGARCAGAWWGCSWWGSL